MAKFTATVPLNMRLPSGEEISGAVGTTHRISDAIVEEFIRDKVPLIPGGVTWITQDEESATVAAHESSTDPHTGYLRAVEGGLAKVLAIGASGGTVTISPASANIFTVTLSAAATIAFGAAQTTRAGFPAQVAIEIQVTQDSTGGRTLTWPGAVTFVGGTPSPNTSASTTSIYLLESIDGGVTWRAVLVGGSVGASGKVLTSDGTNPTWAYPSGYQIAASVITAGVSITGTAESAATTVITANSATFDGTAVYAEFFSPAIRPSNTSAGFQANIYLFEDGVSIGRIGSVITPTTGTDSHPVLARYFFTPSAGSHTYSIRAANATGGTGNVSAGPGGVGNDMPAYLRIFKH